MLDLKFIRENADLVKEGIKLKNESVDISKLLPADIQKYSDGTSYPKHGRDFDGRQK